MQTFHMGQVPPVMCGAGGFAVVSKIVKTLNGGPAFLIADAKLTQRDITDRLTHDPADHGIAFGPAANASGEPKWALVDDLCAQAHDVDAKVNTGLGGASAQNPVCIARKDTRP